MHVVGMVLCIFFFFNDTATTEIYTLSLHDALPISFSLLLRGRGLWGNSASGACQGGAEFAAEPLHVRAREVAVRLRPQDRKSTRLNSSHANISYAVFCLKKKKYIKPRTNALRTILS